MRKVQKRLLESNERIALYRNQPKFVENDKVSMVGGCKIIFNLRNLFTYRVEWTFLNACEMYSLLSECVMVLLQIFLLTLYHVSVSMLKKQKIQIKLEIRYNHSQPETLWDFTDLSFPYLLEEEADQEFKGAIIVASDFKTTFVELTQPIASRRSVVVVWDTTCFIVTSSNTE